MELKDWATVAIIPLALLVIGLILEYKTGWFAGRSDHQSNSEEELDWGTAIIIARQKIAELRSIPVERIQVDWKPFAFGRKARLTLHTGSPFSTHTVIINKKGDILREELVHGTRSSI